MDYSHLSSPFCASTYEEQEKAFKNWQKNHACSLENSAVPVQDTAPLPPLQIPAPVISSGPSLEKKSFEPFRHAQLDKLKERHQNALHSVSNWKSTSDI